MLIGRDVEYDRVQTPYRPSIVPRSRGRRLSCTFSLGLMGGYWEAVGRLVTRAARDMEAGKYEDGYTE